MIARPGLFLAASMAAWLPSGAAMAGDAADACDAVAWRDRVAPSEKAVAEAAPYKVPAAAWRGSVRQACAVVVFTVGGDGRATSPEVVAYSPNAVAAKSALETLARYRFNAPANTRLTLQFQRSRYAPDGE